MTVTYTVTVTDWTQPRGYRGSGRGWRVRCFGLPIDDRNALGDTIHEAFYRTEKKAREVAGELARQYHTTINGETA